MKRQFSRCGWKCCCRASAVETSWRRRVVEAGISKEKCGKWGSHQAARKKLKPPVSRLSSGVALKTVEPLVSRIGSGVVRKEARRKQKIARRSPRPEREKRKIKEGKKKLKPNL